MLAHVDTQGDASVLTDGHGHFAILQIVGLDVDESVMSSYDSDGTELVSWDSSQFTGRCGAALVDVPGVGRLVVTALVTSHPARGIKPAHDDLTLEAFDAVSGAPVWTEKVSGGTENEVSCTLLNSSWASTSDGRWMLVTLPRYRPTVVNLATGALRSDPAATGLLGNFIVGDATDRLMNLSLEDPANGRQVGAVRNVEFQGNDAAGQYAAQQLFASDSAADSAPAGLTDDAQTLIGIPGDRSETPLDRIEGYRLPSDQTVWTVSEPNSSFAILGDGGGVLVTLAGDHLYGIDDATGSQVWRLPPAELCGMTSQETLLQVNGQLATIDTGTGKQISYTSQHVGADGCPEVLPGGLLVEQPDISSVSVFQILQP